MRGRRKVPSIGSRRALQAELTDRTVKVAAGDASLFAARLDRGSVDARLSQCAGPLVDASALVFPEPAYAAPVHSHKNSKLARLLGLNGQ